MISLSWHSPDPNFSSRFGKNLHPKQRGWCELISVVGSRIVVGTHSPKFTPLEFCGKSRIIWHIWMKSFFFIENGNLQQPFYSTHGARPVLHSSLWLAVIIDSFFIGKVKEILLSRTPKTHWDPNLNKYLVHPEHISFSTDETMVDFIGCPAPTGTLALDSSFESFTFLKPVSPVDEQVSLVKVFRLLRSERIVLVFIVWTQ